MQVFMNALGHKYTSPVAKDISDCLLPFFSKEMLDVLEAAAIPLNDAVLAEAIQTLKNLSPADREEFNVQLQEKRDAYIQ